MEAQAQAGIHIHGALLRYAEVAPSGAGCRLLRLGSCDFDFDIAHELLHAEQPSYLEVVAEALCDVFAGAPVARLSVALHPSECFSFFTPLPPGLPRLRYQERFRQEAALMVGEHPEAPLHVSGMQASDARLPDGRKVAWFHVLAVAGGVYRRFERVLRRLPHAGFQLKLSTQGAAAVLNRLSTGEAEDPDAGTLVMAIGQYAGHVEYALCQQGGWYFSHHSRARSPADRAYFAVALLRQLGLTPGAVTALFVYGDHVEPESEALLRAVFGVQPERLDPLRVVDVDPGSRSVTFDAEGYAPCIGVAL